MYHWVSRRIEAHVKICVLALMIERLAELACDKPWHQIHRSLDELQVTKLFHLNYRVHLHNEIPGHTNNILNKLKISPPKQVVFIENAPKNNPIL